MSNIHNYPNEAFQINDEDFYDVDYWNGAAWETRKISGLTLKTALAGSNIYNADGILTGNRLVNFGAFGMAFLDSVGDTIMLFNNIPGANRVEIGDLSGATPLTQTILEVKGRASILGVDINKDITPDLIRFLEGGFSLSLQMQTLLADRIQTFQDADGIIALLSDIPAGAGNNIYNIDGTLLGQRQINMDGFGMVFYEGTEAVMTLVSTPGAARVIIGESNSIVTPPDAIVLEVEGRSITNGIIINGDAEPNLIQFLQNSFDLILQSANPTANRVQTFQDADGIIALLSDIPAGGVNIYDADGTLTADRFVSLGGFQLFFSDTAGATNLTGGNIIEVQANAGQEAFIQLTAGNGEKRGLKFTEQGDPRWNIITADLESGLNSGTNFKIERFDDAGLLIGTVFEISRASGEWTVNDAYSIPDLDGNPGEVLTTNGLGVATWELPVSTEKYVHQWYAYDMSLAASYSWNGITAAAAALTTINESYRAMEFAGVGGADGCFVSGTLPLYYPSNTSLKVTINFSTDGTGGNVRFYIGLQKPNGANYGDDTTTEWKFFTFTANAGLPTGSNTLVFDGTGLTAYNPFSIKVFRNPADANDTYNGDAYITNLLTEIA
jgi:hypothetical protein